MKSRSPKKLLFSLLVLTILWPVIMSSPAHAECPTDMISYWLLDETTGGSYADSMSINGGVCAALCPTPTSEGRINGGQVFDGVATGIDIPAHISFDWIPGDSFSIEYWMKRPTGALSSNEVIIGRNDSSSNLQWWSGLWVEGEAAFVLIATNGDGGSAGQSLRGKKDLTDGLWHHVVVVRDAATNQNILYVDGQMEDSQSVTYTQGFDSETAELNMGYLYLDPFFHFEGVLDEIAVYDKALAELEISQHYYDGLVGLRWGYCACNLQIKIMPLGDSITDGYIDAITDPEYRVGYRQKLYLDLTALGYDVDFIGSQQSGQLTPPAFDYDHEGHPGWTANEIAANVYNWLVNNPVNVVLLHIGTNDLTPYPNYVEDILNEIDAYSKDITVILSRIINHMNYSPETTEFNNNVLAMVKNRIANGDKIILVDHENSLTYPDDTQDDDHPNMDGYNKMAQIWLHALVKFLPSCSVSAPIIITIPSTKTTINIPYSYNVNATSNPVAQYSLLSPPTGMTIDSNTGSITWTPTTLGDFPVTIKATNGQTPDATQDFTINVLELPLNDINLLSGQRMSDFIFQGGWAYYKIDTAASDVELKVELENLSNDVDLYVRMGDRPDDGSYDCRPYLGDTETETCILPNSGANTWFIGVNGYKHGFFTIHPTLFDAQGNIAMFPGGMESGSVEQDQWVFYKIDASDTDSELKVELTNLTNDLDLYVRVGSQPSLTDYDCRPYLGGTSPETCILPNSGANTWYIGVNGYQSGNFKITATLTTEGLAAPTITSTPVTDGIVGQLYSYDVDATGNPAPTYVLTTSPSGMTIDTDTGLIQWTPGAAGNFDVTVEASNSEGTDSQPFTVAVTEGLAAPTITSTPVTDGIVGQLYSYDVDATGNPAPTYVLTTSPSGMTIDTDTGLIQWTPGAAGNFDVTVEASNSEGTDSQPFTVAVTEGLAAPTITSTPVTDGIVGQLYSYDVDATGNPAPTYVLTTSPSGMTIDTDTGLIQWTPGAAGNFDVTVEASNSEGTDSQPFTIAVTEGVIPIPLVSGQSQSGSVLQGEWVYYQISTSSSDTQIEVALTELSDDLDLYVRNGAMPTLSSYDCRPYLGGTDSETCTLANSGANTWYIGVHGYHTGNFTVKATLFDAQGNITLVSGQSQSGSVLHQGEWIYYKINTTSSDTELKVELTNLSNDVDLYVRVGSQPSLTDYDCRPYLGGTSPETCVLPNSGANIWYIGVNGYQSGNFKITATLTTEGLAAPTITSTPVTDGIVGQLYSYDVDATGNPAPTYVLTTSPSGMTIDTDTGLIQWTPGAAGNFDVTVEASNSEGTDSQPFTVAVTEGLAAPTITSTPVTDGIVGQLYSYDVDATGNPAPTYVLTTSPSGMTIDTDTGLIQWTPGAAGNFDVTVEASNSEGTDSQPFTVAVTEGLAAPTITSTPVTDGIVGQLYSYDVDATGNPAPTYVLTTSPSGMTIDTDTGLIQWTPGAAGNFDVTVEASNSEGTDSQPFTIAVTEGVIPIPLVSGQSQSGSVLQGEWVYYQISTSSSDTQIEVALTELSDDLDLYVRNGAMPTLSSYDCRPYLGGTDSETCTLANSGANTWYIGVHGYHTGNFTVKATLFDAQGNITLVSGQSQSGSVLHQGEWIYYKINTTSSDTELKVELTNLSNDVDLYVRVGSQPSLTDYDCRPYLGGTSPETCVLPNSGANIWYIGVNGYQSGNFKITATLN